MIRRAFIFETQLTAKFFERTGVDLSQLSTAAVPDPLKAHAADSGRDGKTGGG